MCIKKQKKKILRSGKNQKTKFSAINMIFKKFLLMQLMKWKKNLQNEASKIEKNCLSNKLKSNSLKDIFRIISKAMKVAFIR